MSTPTLEEQAAQDFRRAAQGGAEVDEFLKFIATKLADEVRLWERSGNAQYIQPFEDSCHRRVAFILSDALGMATIRSMTVRPDYESWVTLSIPHRDGEITANLHIAVRPVRWEILGWSWQRYYRSGEF